ncbi:MAG: flagellin [Oscillospiraceae bacterium]|nr:flagellin [Oscillospiraceae bacterium]
MIIQHNIPAMNSHRQLGINNSATAKNLEKLSSGFRINRAGDDAAGLAISEKMRGQIRGLAQATQNAQNGISLIQTAEGGLNETHAILQRMRELAVQSANGTFKDEVDRDNIQKEVVALKSEIDRIASSTNYNGIQLLNGTMGGAGLNAAGTHFMDGSNSGAGTAHATARANVLGAAGNITWTTAANGGYMQEELAGMSEKAVATIVTAQVGSSWVTSVQLGDRSFTIEDDDGGGGNLVDANGVVAGTIASWTQATTARVISGVEIDNDATGAFSGTYAEGAMYANSSSKLIFQIGANGSADQRVGLNVANMSSGALGGAEGVVNNISVATGEDAKNAIKVLTAAMDMVSGTRADLGALQNRLEHTVNNLGVTRENLQNAEASIRDVDMAKEMMEFTKNNILVQASQAMLAQSNQLPQGVLQLLR